LQVVLNRREKEHLVIQLYQQGKTMREIASAVHMSFGDIGAITRRINGQDGIEIDAEIKDLKNKSKESQALYLFSIGKKPIEVAIELDLPTYVVHDIQEEFFALNDLYELELVYDEIKAYLPSFLKLFHCLKQRHMLGEKQISEVLECAKDLSHLTNRVRCVTNNLIELETQKTDLINKVILWNAQLCDLDKAIDLKTNNQI
jgi:hypothetical protein